MEWILNWLTPALATAAIGLSIFTYLRQRQSQRFNNTHQFNQAWYQFNQAVIEFSELLDFEIERHPHGHLEPHQMKLVYFYHMRFSIVYAAFKNQGELDDDHLQSAFHNEANISYRDRQFIIDNVFGRGYDVSFSNKFIDAWKKIDQRKGKSLPMLGDVSERYTSTLTREKSAFPPTQRS